ncbi:MAG TPA: TolC family protein, partial [Kiritimatiellia bacterium]|nr:TolC family protein [Kiritimatiellia bacterium]
ALAALANDGERLAALHDAVTAAQQTADLVDELYRTGLTDFQGVLDAQRQLAEYQDALAQSLGQSAADLVAAYKAFGGGWAPDGPPAADEPPAETDEKEAGAEPGAPEA